MKIKCFLGFHKWMPVARQKGKTTVENHDVVLCLDRCIHCDKEWAYISGITGDYTVGLEYAKGILGIK